MSAVVCGARVRIVKGHDHLGKIGVVVGVVGNDFFWWISMA